MCSINHDKKSIFIHIPKSGGSYICDILRYIYYRSYLIYQEYNLYLNILGMLI